MRVFNCSGVQSLRIAETGVPVEVFAGEAVVNVFVRSSHCSVVHLLCMYDGGISHQMLCWEDQGSKRHKQHPINTFYSVGKYQCLANIVNQIPANVFYLLQGEHICVYENWFQFLSSY